MNRFYLPLGFWLLCLTAFGQTFEKVKHFYPNGDDAIRNLTTFQNKLIFFVGNPFGTDDLWVSDGTDAGSIQIASGLTRGYDGFIQSGDKLYFLADDGTHGMELWVTDGSASGTHLVKDTHPGFAGQSGYLVAAGFDNKLYYAADDGQTGWELWYTDGTDTGTHFTQDLNPGQNGAFSLQSPPNFTAFGDDLYFHATTSDPYGEVFRIHKNENTISSLQLPAMAPAGVRLGSLIFTANSSNAPYDIAFYDSALTLNWYNIPPPSSYGHSGLVTTDDNQPIISNGHILYRIDTGYYFLNPTVSDFYQFLPGLAHYIMNSVMKDSTLYFVENNNGSPLLYTTSLNSPQPLVLTPINDFSGSPLQAALGQVFFSNPQNIYGTEPWHTDGTSAGTHILKDINPGTFSSISWWYSTVYNGRLFFAAQDTPVTGSFLQQLWATGGTIDGTVKITGPMNTVSTPLSSIETVYNGCLYLSGNYDNTYVSLWKYCEGTTGANSEVSNDNDVLLYPNPTQGNLEIQFSEAGSITPIDLTIFDGAGRIMGQKILRPQSGQAKYPLHMESYAAGTYLLRLHCLDRDIFKKIVVIK